MKVKVIYPANNNFGQKRIEFHVNIPKTLENNFTNTDDDKLYLLEYVWRKTNVVDESDIQRMREYAKEAGVDGVRSMMVGDMCQYPDGSVYRCATCGFEKI